MRNPDFARAWLQQVTAGARAVAAVERQERAHLSDEQALRDADSLLDAAPLEAEPWRRAWSGFVEQQRLFALGLPAPGRR